MTRDLKLGIKLTADGKGFVGAVRISKRELDKLTGSTTRGANANRAYARTARQTEVATRRVGRSFAEAHGRHLKYLSGFVGIATARTLVRYADSYTKVSNSVRLATNSAAEFTAVNDELFAIAQRTRAPLESVADLYQKLSISSKELGATQEEMLQVVEGVGQALVVNGTDAQAASGALLQFSQAMGSSIVRAEEFNSILEGAKPILIAVANNMDKAGGSVSKLRQLVADGQVTNTEFFEALKKGLPELESAFLQADATIGQGFIQVSNSLTKLVGETNKALGASKAFSEGLESLAGVIANVDADELAGALRHVDLVLVALAARMAGPFVASAAKATASLAGMSRASALATVRLTAMASATKVVNRALALVGGKGGLFLLAAYGAYEFATANNVAAKSVDELAQETEELTKKLNNSTAAQAKRFKLDKQIEIDQQKDALDRAKRELAAYESVGQNIDDTFGSISLDDSANNKLTRLRADVADAQDVLDPLVAQMQLIDQFIETGSAANPNTLKSKNNSNTDKKTTDKKSLSDFAKIQADARTELEKINDTYNARIKLIDSNTQAQSAQNGRLKDWVTTQRDSAKAALEEKQVREQGLTTLDALRERNEQLNNVVDFSTKAIERQARETRVTNEVLGQYKDANTQVTDEIIALTLANENQLAKLKQISPAYQTVQQAHLRYVDEITALEALRSQEGVDRRLLELELERLHSEGILEVKRQLWEQEALEAQGYRNREAEAELAHKNRLTDIQYNGSTRISSVLKKFNELDAIQATEGEKLSINAKKRQAKIGLSILEETAGNLATHNKKAFRLKQAASIATALVDTYSAATAALDDFPTPLNYVAAAAVTVAGLANVAAIRSQQPPQAFALGGVVDSPTFFQANNVRNGLAGEAGPEAILPLTRLPDGVLGVRAGGGNSKQNNVVINVEVAVNDNNSDPELTGQQVGAAIRQQLEPLVLAIMADQQRPGGQLNALDQVA